MENKKNTFLSIGRKLILAFFLIVIIMAVQSFIAARFISNISNDTKETLILLSKLKNLKEYIDSVRLTTFQYLGSSNPDEHQKLSKKISASVTQITQISNAYPDLQNAILLFVANHQSGIELHDQFQTKQAYKIIYNEAQINYDKLLDKVSIFINKKELDLEENNDLKIRNSLYFNFCTLSFAIVFAIILASMLKKSIVSPIQSIAKTVSRIADGDLTQNLEDSNREDELGVLISATTNMSLKLQNALKIIATQTAELENMSQHINKITEETKLGVDQQKRDTQQAATAVTQMSATIQEISNQAALAASNAKTTDEDTQNGQAIVQKAIESINYLSEELAQVHESITELANESERVGIVLEVIRGIAEQTNLLALNAAIEAARAGEQGRGFSVVADEVRTLAQKTESSTKEIQEIIERLQNRSKIAGNLMEQGRLKMQNSVDSTADAGKCLIKIAESASSISNINNFISTAVTEQRSATQEIEKIIISINDVSLKSSQQATNLSQSSAKLLELSHSLKHLLSQFKIQNS
ncbi:MAG: methyl-accepting chemotaxis protein [Gammaproteobacteria bacterium]